MKLYSYRKLFFSVLFSAIAVLIFSQNSENSNEASKKKLPEEDKILLDGQSSGNTGQDGVAIPAASQEERRTTLDNAVGNGGSSFAGSMLQLFFALLIICVLAYIILKFLKKSSKFYGTDDPYLKNVASINIAQGKSIHVITLGEKAYVIGVTDSGISKIGEVEDKNLIDAMNLENDKKMVSPKKDFSSILSHFIPSMKQEKQDSLSDDFFVSQMERLNNAAGDNREKE